MDATSGGDRVPLASRVQRLTLLRVSLAAVVVVCRFVAPRLVGGDIDELLSATGIYLAIAAVSELVRLRLAYDRTALTAMLIADGLFLAHVIDRTGGQSSVLGFLISLHLVAVTLLVSYLTGLRMTAWYLILLVAAVQLRPDVWVDPERTIVFGMSIVLVGVGAAAFSAVNERELRRRRSDVEALHEFALALDHARHADDVAQVLAERAMHLADLSACIVLSHRDGTDAILATTGAVAADARRVLSIGPWSVVREAWREHGPIVVSRLDPDKDPGLCHSLPSTGPVAVVPMFSEGRPTGALVASFGRVRNNRVERNVVATIEQFTAHASLALQNAWLLHDVEQLAVTDDLTRLANRRQLKTALTRALAKAKADNTPFGFVLVDLDRFKVLNDTHGHLTGDDVLRRVSEVLVGVTDLGDTVARYGGEEFALVLPGRDSAATAAVAERARFAVAGLREPVRVTASFGACSFPADAADGPALVRAADEAMYESKRAGRNRVTSAADRTEGWLDLPWRSIDLDAPVR